MKMINKLTKAQKTKVDKIFKHWDNKDTPGCAIGIIKDKKLIYAKGYGMANLEYDIPNDMNSVFNIGSVAKQFAAACIHILAKKRKLSLNDTLSKYFPDFPKYADIITIKHLLHHTSGLKDWLTLMNFTEKPCWAASDMDVLYLLKKQQSLNHKPGEELSYTNTGYYLLGKIIEKISGVPLSEFAEKNIFIPLKMKNTHFRDNPYIILRNRSNGYHPDGKGSFHQMPFSIQIIGDGGIYTTVEDMFKWDTNFYDNKVGGKNFTKTMERLGVLNSGKKTNMGTGLVIASYKGLKVVSHGGMDIGYMTEFQRFPEQNFSVIIMTNRQDHFPYDYCLSIVDIFLKDQFVEKSKENIKKVDIPEKVDISINKLNEYTGTYWCHKKFISRKVYLKENKLWYVRYPGNESELLPYSKNEFKMLGVPVDARLTFATDKNKEKILSMTVDGGDPDIFVITEKSRFTQKELKQYTGKFYSPEVGTTFEFKIVDKELTLFFKDTKVFKIDLIAKNIFNFSGSVFYEFTKLKNNKFNGLLISANRGSNIKYERIEGK